MRAIRIVTGKEGPLVIPLVIRDIEPFFTKQLSEETGL
jgi:hypothetical protein